MTALDFTAAHLAALSSVDTWRPHDATAFERDLAAWGLVAWDAGSRPVGDDWGQVEQPRHRVTPAGLIVLELAARLDATACPDGEADALGRVFADPSGGRR